MKVKSMEDLYIESLRDLYSAENMLTEALPKMAEKASNEELKAAFEEHLEVTRGHVERLEGIFEDIGEDPDGEECDAMKGLIKEAEKVMGEVDDQSVCDAAMIGAAQKVEHYEIAGYGTARTFARLLGYQNHVEELQSTLDEEYEADEKLNQIAESAVNAEAEQADGGQRESA